MSNNQSDAVAPKANCPNCTGDFDRIHGDQPATITPSTEPQFACDVCEFTGNREQTAEHRRTTEHFQRALKADGLIAAPSPDTGDWVTRCADSIANDGALGFFVTEKGKADLAEIIRTHADKRIADLEEALRGVAYEAEIGHGLCWCQSATKNHMPKCAAARSVLEDRK